jgi:hypothetical protein
MECNGGANHKATGLLSWGATALAIPNYIHNWPDSTQKFSERRKLDKVVKIFYEMEEIWVDLCFADIERGK